MGHVESQGCRVQASSKINPTHRGDSKMQITRTAMARKKMVKMREMRISRRNSMTSTAMRSLRSRWRPTCAPSKRNSMARVKKKKRAKEATKRVPTTATARNNPMTINKNISDTGHLLSLYKLLLLFHLNHSF